MMLDKYSENDKQKYIQDTLGEDVLSKIQHIHQGGVNASKGQKYEELFLLFKVLEIASQNTDWVNHRFSHQNLDFFDDVCYEDFSSSTKHNYQAKNSALQAANWNEEHSERARNQIELDLNFHKAYSKNYLVVPSEEKQQQNIHKIPKDLKGQCECIFFPYENNNFSDFVDSYLSPVIEPLIQFKEISDKYYAAQLLLGILSAHTKPRTLEEIFSKAESEGYPNPFSNPQQMKMLPSWIETLLKGISQDVSYSIKGSFLFVTYKYLDIKIPFDTLLNIKENNMMNISDIESLIGYLMQLSAKSLTRDE